MKYRYAPQLRPPSFATLPFDPDWELVERGVYAPFPLRQDLPLGQHPYGVVEYPRRLTRDECRQYDLRSV
jgi:hypothetical protein